MIKITTYLLLFLYLSCFIFIIYNVSVEYQPILVAALHIANCSNLPFVSHRFIQCYVIKFLFHFVVQCYVFVLHIVLLPAMLLSSLDPVSSLFILLEDNVSTGYLTTHRVVKCSSRIDSPLD